MGYQLSGSDDGDFFIFAADFFDFLSGLLAFSLASRRLAS